MLQGKVWTVVFACAWSAHAQAEGDSQDTLSLPPGFVIQQGPLQTKDSASVAAGTGLQDRLGRFPSMRVDQQGRLKWRGTDEFRVQMSGLPIDADLLPALPSGLEAGVYGDPQPDARFSSAGMTGILHMDPKPAEKASFLRLRAGGGLPAREWVGGSGQWYRPSFRAWGQAQHQGLDETTDETWKGTHGASVKRSWDNTENRNLGLLGASVALGPSQTAEMEGWINRSDYVRPFSQVRFEEGAIDSRWRPEGEAQVAAGKGAWTWEARKFRLQAEAAGLTDRHSVDMGDEVLDHERDWARGRGSFLWQFTPDLSAEAGGEHAWDGRRMTDLGTDGALWEENIDAAWLQGHIRWRGVDVTAGLRWENTDRAMTDDSYSLEEWRLLPSATVTGTLPRYDIDAYVRYSRRMELPHASFVVPGDHRVGSFEWHRGNGDLEAETIHGTEFGIILPVPQWKGRFEAKAFSALADHMLIRRFAWAGDSTFLSISNGLGENRRGGEGSWEQEIPGGTYRFNLGGWLEDREVEGPKEELVGLTGHVHLSEHLGKSLMLGVDLGFTGPTFEAEGEAGSYWEEGLRLDWAPSSHWVLHLGGEAFWGEDRTLEIVDATGGAWKRTRHGNGPRAWANLEWKI